MVVKLVNGSEVTITYGGAINMSDLEDRDLNVKAADLHLESPKTGEYMGGPASLRGFRMRTTGTMVRQARSPSPSGRSKPVN